MLHFRYSGILCPERTEFLSLSDKLDELVWDAFS